MVWGHRTPERVLRPPKSDMGIENPIIAQDTWLAQLRARFVDVTRGRVAEGSVEDVVQDALAIIHEEGGGKAGGGLAWSPPALPWCFRVLRNVIGNHYQRERTRLRAARPGSETHAAVEEFTARRLNPTPVESLESRERTRLLQEAVAELASQDDFCGKHFVELLNGPTIEPSASHDRSAMTSADRVANSTPYVRLFRCREKLRRILVRRGYLP